MTHWTPPGPGPATRTWVRFWGGPRHGQTMRVDGPTPPHALRVLFPTEPPTFGGPPDVDHLADDSGTYLWQRASIGAGGMRYEYASPDRSSWGNWMDLRDVDYHLRGHRHHLDRIGGTWEAREPWIWVFPTSAGLSLTVVERIQVLHADVPYPILGHRPEHTIGAAL